MQCFDNGCLFTVTATRNDVQTFRDNWPCNGMRDKPLTFTFDKRNGDLVDSNDADNHPNADGAAVLALCDNCKTYGQKRLKLTF